MHGICFTLTAAGKLSFSKPHDFLNPPKTTQLCSLLASRVPLSAVLSSAALQKRSQFGVIVFHGQQKNRCGFQKERFDLQHGTPKCSILNKLRQHYDINNHMNKLYEIYKTVIIIITEFYWIPFLFHYRHVTDILLCLFTAAA